MEVVLLILSSKLELGLSLSESKPTNLLKFEGMTLQPQP